MFTIQRFASMLFVLTLLFTQVGNVAAAPQPQDVTPVAGTLQRVVLETDDSGITTVVLTVADAQGAVQSVRVSLETALALGVVVLDPATRAPVVDEAQYGQTVAVDPSVILPEDDPAQEDVHPIAAILAEFFGEDPAVVDAYHEEGFGFGVIVQALWMSKSLTEDETTDADLAGCILDAKKNGTYGECFDFGDEPVPTNWGQFKKAFKQHKDKHNLGVIVSGHAEDENDETQQNHGNGQDNNKNKDKDKNKKDKDKNNNKP